MTPASPDEIAAVEMPSAAALLLKCASQAANLLACNRIALVRHGRAAALLAAERLFRLAHFGALQVANLQGN